MNLWLLLLFNELCGYYMFPCRAALGEGSAHPWQLTVRDTDAEIELVPAVGGEPRERSPRQKTIGVLNPLASTIDGTIPV